MQASQSATQRARFELNVTVADKPTSQRRWNGGPLASAEAREALLEGVEAFQAALRRRGFEIGHSGYGVTAEDITDAF